MFRKTSKNGLWRLKAGLIVPLAAFIAAGFTFVGRYWESDRQYHLVGAVLSFAAAVSVGYCVLSRNRSVIFRAYAVLLSAIVSSFLLESLLCFTELPLNPEEIRMRR